MAKEVKRGLELVWDGKQKWVHEPEHQLEEQSLLSYTATNPGLSNRLIQGDNLPALRLLEPEFRGKIRCVYIDPPYNTGIKFTHYKDKLSHNDWLSFMKVRLEAIKPLLSEDGSLWISIDDRECHYLKVLCDEVFGRENFVSNIVWEKKCTVANDTQWFSDNHDHLLVYAKNKQVWRPGRLERTSKMDARYSNPDNHPRGLWKANPLYAKRTGSDKEQEFSFTFRNGVVWTVPKGTSPRYSKETLAAMDAADEIWFGVKGDATPSRKIFLDFLTNPKPPSATFWRFSDAGHNFEAREEVKSLSPKDPFPTPKPERFLKRILDLATNSGDLVLDCFAGSGTTGAVAHKMGRRWIMVEYGSHAETHIATRMQKVIDGLDLGGVTKDTSWTGGGGFAYYTVTTKEKSEA